MRIKGIVPKNFIEERIFVEQILREEQIRSYEHKLLSLTGVNQEGAIRQKSKITDKLISLVNPEIEDIERYRTQEIVDYLKEEQKKVHTFKIESNKSVDISELERLGDS